MKKWKYKILKIDGVLFAFLIFKTLVATIDLVTTWSNYTQKLCWFEICMTFSLANVFCKDWYFLLLLLAATSNDPRFLEHSLHRSSTHFPLHWKYVFHFSSHISLLFHSITDDLSKNFWKMMKSRDLRKLSMFLIRRGTRVIRSYLRATMLNATPVCSNTWSRSRLHDVIIPSYSQESLLDMSALQT